MAYTLRYSTPDRVARYLGATFTASQLQEAEAMVAAAEAWIDQYQGRVYGSAVVTEEAYWPVGSHLYLRSRPVASVEAVTARYSMSHTPDTALVLGTGYEVRDLASGWLYVPGADYYDRILVSYTPSTTVPANIATAATMLAAHWLQASVGGVLPGVQSYTVGQELSVTFAEAATLYGVPADVTALLGGPTLAFA